MTAPVPHPLPRPPLVYVRAAVLDTGELVVLDLDTGGTAIHPLGRAELIDIAHEATAVLAGIEAGTAETGAIWLPVSGKDGRGVPPLPLSPQALLKIARQALSALSANICRETPS